MGWYRRRWVKRHKASSAQYGSTRQKAGAKGDKQIVVQEDPPCSKAEVRDES